MEILKDIKFEKGFHIGHNNSLIYTGTMMEWMFNDSLPDWKICQWESKYPLYKDNVQIDDGDYHSMENKQKKIIRYADGTLDLNIKSDLEYPLPRSTNQGWPHLLIEQFFDHEVVSKMEKLVMEIDFEFLNFTDHMGSLRNDLHTLQVSWYLALGNKNKHSQGYNDFYWFGLPFIDYPRYDFPHSFEAVDGGKADATNKYIICIDPHIYLKENTKVGEHIHIKIDVLPYIKEAFAKAKAKGYLANTNFEDIEIISTNFGFEDTGTFDGTLRIHQISLTK